MNKLAGLFGRKTAFKIEWACGPLIRMTAIPASPSAEDITQMVSGSCIPSSGRRDDDPLGVTVSFTGRADSVAALEKSMYNAPLVWVQRFGLDRFSAPSHLVCKFLGHDDDSLFPLFPEVIDIE